MSIRTPALISSTLLTMLRMNRPCDHLQTPFLPKKRADLTKTLCGPLCWWRYFCRMPLASRVFKPQKSLRTKEKGWKKAHSQIFWRVDANHYRGFIAIWHGHSVWELGEQATGTASDEIPSFCFVGYYSFQWADSAKIWDAKQDTINDQTLSLIAAFGVPNIPLHTSLTSPWRQSQLLACVETGHLPNLPLGDKIINSDHSGLWHPKKLAQSRLTRRGCHPDVTAERSTLINLQFASWLENSFEPVSSNF